MNITERNVPHIDNDPIVVKKKNVPQSTNKSLPLLFHTMLLTGKKGAGKTYKIVKLLQGYEKSKLRDKDDIDYGMRIIIIAPTANSGSNEVYKTLKSLNEKDIHLDYSDQILDGILTDIKQKQKEYEGYLEYKRIYDKFLRVKTVTKMKYEEMEILEMHDFQTPKDAYGDIKPLVTWIIFDDLVGTGAFNRKAKSMISNLTIKHRHLRTNLIFTTQSYKQLPIIIRVNIDILVLFKTGSDTELTKIFDDVSGYIKYDQFLQLYDYATDEKNDAFIVINNSMEGKGTRYYKNWDKELLFN
jgi:hypothetical protein